MELWKKSERKFKGAMMTDQSNVQGKTERVCKEKSNPYSPPQLVLLSRLSPDGKTVVGTEGQGSSRDLGIS